MNCPTSWRAAIDEAWNRVPTGRKSWPELAATIRSILEDAHNQALRPVQALEAIDEAIAAYCRVALILDGVTRVDSRLAEYRRLSPQERR